MKESAGKIPETGATPYAVMDGRAGIPSGVWSDAQ
jgi:hypothetical protein